MGITIQHITDVHDCETCGYSCADGYVIYHNGKIISDKTPSAHCYDSVDYSADNPYKDIVDYFGVGESELIVEVR